MDIIYVISISLFWGAIHFIFIWCCIGVLEMKPRRLIFALYRSRAHEQICLEVLRVHYLYLGDAKHQTEAHIKVCQLPSHPFPWWWRCCACMPSVVSWSKTANCILHFLCRNMCCCPSSTLATTNSSHLAACRPSLPKCSCRPYNKDSSVDFFHKVVEGLVPAMPPEHFLTQQRPWRLVCSCPMSSAFSPTRLKMQ